MNINTTDMLMSILRMDFHFISYTNGKIPMILASMIAILIFAFFVHIYSKIAGHGKYVKTLTNMKVMLAIVVIFGVISGFFAMQGNTVFMSNPWVMSFIKLIMSIFYIYFMYTFVKERYNNSEKANIKTTTLAWLSAGLYISIPWIAYIYIAQELNSDSELSKTKK